MNPSFFKYEDKHGLQAAQANSPQASPTTHSNDAVASRVIAYLIGENNHAFYDVISMLRPLGMKRLINLWALSFLEPQVNVQSKKTSCLFIEVL